MERPSFHPWGSSSSTVLDTVASVGVQQQLVQGDDEVFLPASLLRLGVAIGFSFTRCPIFVHVKLMVVGAGLVIMLVPTHIFGL
jgi:hypothetical protein